MTEAMEQYMSKTQENYGSGVTRPTINQDTPFELKGKFLKELRDITFSGSKHEDANEHLKKVLEIVDLFYIPKVTQDQIMLRAFPVSLTGAASRWLRNQPPGSITTWEVLKTKFLNKYCPPARAAKKMEEINNFQQEPNESLFCAWERFKELLMKYPQHYLTDMQEVILFYNRLDDEGKSHAKTLIDVPVFVGSFSIILGFTIIDDDDMTKDVVLGMKFCKKYTSCQRIMKRFALGNNCERIMKDE
ncbi:retrovirus-related pol polyprotein from transposon TNT 1-94 [Tanacetum coccineum]